MSLLRRIGVFLLTCIFLGGVMSGPAVAVPAPLEVRSASAILIDARTGQILYEKNAHEKRPIASVTKLMTLLLAFEAIEAGNLALEDRITASERAYRLGGTTIFLEIGEEMTAKDILTGIAVGSGNDASVAIAEHLAGTVEKFVEMMNARAQTLGMKETHFANPHGLDDPDNYSSAYDLALLSQQATRHPGLLELTSIYLTYLRGGKTMLANFNKLVRFYNGADGLKTGHTDKAGYCIAVTAQREDSRFIAILLGAPDAKTRQNEVTTLLNYAFANYESVPIIKEGKIITPMKVLRGEKETVDIVAKEDLAVTLPKGEKLQLQQSIHLPEKVNAPLTKGAKIGELVLTKAGKEIARVDLVAGEEVKATGILVTIWKVFLDFWRR
ncbi:MAG: D-alanyl-D-alanine carboxypeptidase [Firmicutes bacterium]|nr:D-alanyl-D-alanine carboxypeptidase [Bacillota bacterium]MCL5038696.1 D-alanyl-D-alanine carboxypeptidase [Bacillota bacterium]